MLARIGLGSNVGDAVAHVETALAALERHGRLRARSSLYRTAAWGVQAQPDFINAAALLETLLAPHDLLAALKALEAELGRVATFRWGPRVIDLDILAYDDVTLREPDLVIPHERLHERAFALVPLAEIDPAYASLLAALPAAERDAVQRIPVAAARSARAVAWDDMLERVRLAADFCSSAGLVRFRIEEDALAIEIRRSPRASAPASALPEASDDLDETAATHAASNGSSHSTKSGSVLKAEFVGIVRLSRPAVAVGAEIAGDRELAYVESLGIRNPVRSGGPGRIADVFVSDGDAVEYGQPLFAFET
ncbi:MAG: hypothetical protein NVS2B8_17650 [Vulcanimicrobiaceae bacterium]